MKRLKLSLENLFPKGLFILILFLSFCFPVKSIYSQQCFPEGIYFEYQADIDDFQTNNPGCHYILGDVILENLGNGDITNLNGLSVLDSIGGLLKIEYLNADGAFLNGLSNLVYIGGDLIIEGNSNLSGFGGLDNITKIYGNLDILDNPRLVTLFGFGGITEIDGRLWIRDCDSLPSPGGIGGLTTIGTDLIIENNLLMTTLNALQNVTSIGGDLSIIDNYSLTDLNLIDLESIGANLTIRANNNLTTLGGLDGATGINGNMEIKLNSKLSSLFGLGGITEIGADLLIQDNSLLVSVNALQNVTSIGGDLTVRANSSLDSLIGLQNIDPSSITSLTIRQNVSLTMCEIQSVCDYLAAGGSSDIENNALDSECRDLSAVEDACGITSIEDMFSTRNPGLITFPNPTSGVFYIEADDIEGCELRIFNITGMLLQKLQLTGNGQVDISNMPKGLYFIEMRNKDLVGVGKILKE